MYILVLQQETAAPVAHVKSGEQSKTLRKKPTVTINTTASFPQPNRNQPGENRTRAIYPAAAAAIVALRLLVHFRKWLRIQL